MSLNEWRKKKLEQNLGEKYEKRKKSNRLMRNFLICISVVLPITSLFIDITFSLLVAFVLVVCWIFFFLAVSANEALKKQAERQLKEIEQNERNK